VVQGSGETDGGEEVVGEAVVSSCNTANILEASERALDDVAVTVEVGREAILPASVDLRRHIGGGALALDLAADCVAVIPLVVVQDRASK
jgi:hypothetical protein